MYMRECKEIHWINKNSQLTDGSYYIRRSFLIFILKTLSTRRQIKCDFRRVESFIQLTRVLHRICLVLIDFLRIVNRSSCANQQN